ncbi:polyprenyl synthetase family protein [Thiomicrospira sp. ALE5]|uniref:polyprenyl synthetase family protein n=1 Tax=Thiomicrospira sp. ALE5 TaxID=748650 RepID=UPI0008F39902|nr:farnesyl diphosphate synthase [Thiomicrospira sp. ALE5]SFR51197.1 farnesyl diphosphate synthase [Thiomicrospira sp. ALE5]
MQHEQLTRIQTKVNQHLNVKIAQFTDQDILISPLIEALNYASAQGGKRLRPALCLSLGDALALNHDALLDCATAIEFIHAYSLVHDDLPAMDNDVLRRGKPTCHVAFGEATAILAGDALQGLALQTLLESNHLSSDQKILSTQTLLTAAGPQGMIAGQMLDMLGENTPLNLDQLNQLHQLKTGALIKVSLLFGAITSPYYEDLQPILVGLGDAIGLAFQIQDDILDIEAPTEKRGKTQGRDSELGKSTYPGLLGLAHSKIMRDQLISQAFQYLSQLQTHPAINDDLRFLAEIIQFIGEREH